MNEKEKQFAEQAGFEVHHAGIATVNFWIDTKLERFAQLIRADELEKLNNIFDDFTEEEFLELYEDNKVRYANSKRFPTMFAMSIWVKIYQKAIGEQMK